MKKLAIATAVLASLTASTAFAEITLDVYGDRTTNESFSKTTKSTQGVELGYTLEGLDLSAEVTTNKDIDLGAAYKFELGESFYVKPQAGYVYKWDKKRSASTGWGQHEHIEGQSRATLLGLESDVVKIGLEAGAEFGSFFTSARYRAEYNVDATGLRIEEQLDGGIREVTVSARRGAIGRTDVLVGYNFEAVTLTAKGIHKTQLNDRFRDVNKFLGDSNSNITSEYKATLTAFDGVAPYIQYAHNHDNHDNQVKLGAKFSF